MGEAELWDVTQVCDYLGIKKKTWYAYHSRGIAPRPYSTILREGRGRLVWDAAEIRAWHARRHDGQPGAGLTAGG